MASNFISEFLGREIFVNSFVYIDGWTFGHIGFGILIALLLIALIKNKFSLKVGLLFFVLILWEVFEFVLYGVISPPIIAIESKIDVLTDVWLAFLSGLVVLTLFKD